MTLPNFICWSDSEILLSPEPLLDNILLCCCLIELQWSVYHRFNKRLLLFTFNVVLDVLGYWTSIHLIQGRKLVRKLTYMKWLLGFIHIVRLIFESRMMYRTIFHKVLLAEFLRKSFLIIVVLLLLLDTTVHLHFILRLRRGCVRVCNLLLLKMVRQEGSCFKELALPSMEIMTGFQLILRGELLQ